MPENGIVQHSEGAYSFL